MSLDKDGILSLNQGSKLKFVHSSYNVTIQPSSSLTSNLTFTLPTSDGDSGQFLKTDGTGVLSWDSASGSSSGRTITTGGGSVDTGVIKGSVGVFQVII